MLYHQKPEKFPLDMQVSEGILECGGEILIVQRADHCSSPGTWSGPGGKLDPGEDFDTALMRELKEEIGIDVSPYKKEVLFHKYFYFLGKNIEIKFYKVLLNQKPNITLNNEHQDYLWIDPQEALSMNLTEDFDTILKEIYWL